MDMFDENTVFFIHNNVFPDKSWLESQKFLLDVRAGKDTNLCGLFWSMVLGWYAAPLAILIFLIPIIGTSIIFVIFLPFVAIHEAGKTVSAKIRKRRGISTEPAELNEAAKIWLHVNKPWFLKKKLALISELRDDLDVWQSIQKHSDTRYSTLFDVIGEDYYFRKSENAKKKKLKTIAHLREVLDVIEKALIDKHFVQNALIALKSNACPIVKIQENVS